MEIIKYVTSPEHVWAVLLIIWFLGDAVTDAIDAWRGNK